MSESRIIVTQKGRETQKELSNEKQNRGRVVFSPSPRSTQGSFRVKKSHQSLEKTNSETQFNTTVRCRSGYFGPKKLLKEARNSMANYKPPYYPNYLRKSQEDYPSSHFEILTPEKILKEARSNSHYLLPRKYSARKEETTEHTEPSVLRDERLPMRYVHHTVFPYTLPDKPQFLKKTDSNAPSLRQTRASFYDSNNPPQRHGSMAEISNRSININGHTLQDFHLSQMSFHKKSRVDEFQKTMYSQNNTIVSEHYSKQVVDKYDDGKLNKIKDKHSIVQRQFREMLDVIEEKWQKKARKVEENTNEVPEFQATMRKSRVVFETRDQNKINETLRLMERLNTIQSQKYSNLWQRFGNLSKPPQLSHGFAVKRVNPEVASRGSTIYNVSAMKRKGSLGI